MPHVATQQDPKVSQCIQDCVDCHAVCLQTINHCLTKGGKHAGQDHIRLLTNCAEFCQNSVNFMLTNSEFRSENCRLCADICDRCADVCEAIDSTDPQMKACVDICRRCATSCRDMSGGKRRAA